MAYLTSCASGLEVPLITGLGLFGKLFYARGVSTRGYIRAVRHFCTCLRDSGRPCTTWLRDLPRDDCVYRLVFHATSPSGNNSPYTYYLLR